MSEKLYEGIFLSVDSFYGGSDRGVCVQITGCGGFVQLSRAHVEILIQILNDWLKK